jgi:uncharacterized membrane protein YqjE
MRTNEFEADGHITEHPERYSGMHGNAQRRGFTTANGRSVAGLLRDISTETVTLVRQELDLARAEMREKLDVYQRSTMTLGAGAVLLLAALLTGLWALNTGITALLE